MILIFILLLATSSALADIPEPWQDDVLGMWFDDAAISPCIDTTEPNQEVVGYVIVRHLPSNLLTYELGLTIENAENLSNMQVSLRCGFDVSDDDLDYVVADCLIQLDANVVLMSIHATVIHPNIPVSFYLRAYDIPGGEPYPECVGSPCYAALPGDIRSFLPANGSWRLPAAVINGGDPCEVVVRDKMSWSAVKALYR